MRFSKGKASAGVGPSFSATKKLGTLNSKLGTLNSKLGTLPTQVMKYVSQFFLAVCCVGMVLAAGPVRGQEVMRLTLDDAVQLAQRESPAAERAEHTYDRARWAHEAFESRYLPQLSFTGEVPGLVRSISEIQQDDGSVRYVTQRLTRSTTSLSISQPIPFTGGNLFVSSGLSRVDQFGGFGSGTGRAQWQSTPLSIGLSQPLLAFNEMKWERRLEPLEFQYARRGFTQDMAAISVEVADQFFEVYIAQMAVENADFNVAVNDTIYQLSEGRFEIGKIAENDLLQSELALLNAQTAQSDARVAYEEAVRNLKIVLGLPYDTDLEVIPPHRIPRLELDPDRAVAEARDRRPEFLDLELQSLEAERELARAASENGFSADLFARFGLNQTGPGLGDVYRNPLNQQRFSVGFSMPIFSWGQSRAEEEAARANQRRVEETVDQERRVLEQQVYFQVLQLQQLRQRVQIAAKADTVANRRFEVARNRYTIGKIDITDLFDAQREKDQAREAYIQTLRQFWITYFRVRQLTHFDFEQGEPLRYHSAAE